MTNFLLRTDSYKLSHWKQYPPDSEIVYSYLEARGYSDIGAQETVFFGLQPYLEKYLKGSVFTPRDIDHAESFARQHFGADLFNGAGWRRMYQKYQGCLPLRIRAVAEGSVVPVGNALMTVENTDPEFPWLTNYVESLKLKVWYPITVATLSREVKKIIHHYLDLTGDPTQISFKLHDFGYRGVSSEESAAIGGAAHLVNFLGSDTLLGIDLLQNYYFPSTFPGFSVPASEHSTMTSWGQAHEVEAMANMLDKYPTGLVSVVSDSYNILHACSELWGTQLHDRVISRNGVLVIRPDSGDPTPTIMKILEILGQRFGSTRNTKGFLELDPHVRIIQGDGVNPSAIRRILDTMRWQGWSANNITFGMGGALLQQVNRDTQKFAFKCSAIQRSGEWQDVYKTATGKQSKRGRLSLIKVNDQYETVPFQSGEGWRDELVRVFENGIVYSHPTLDDIRSRARI